MMALGYSWLAVCVAFWTSCLIGIGSSHDLKDLVPCKYQSFETFLYSKPFHKHYKPLVCSDFYCLNGGSCYCRKHGYEVVQTCVCPPGFGGARCEDACVGVECGQGECVVRKNNERTSICNKGFCLDPSTISCVPFQAFPAAYSIACNNDFDCFQIEGTRCFQGECRCQCGRTPSVPSTASGGQIPYCAEEQPCSSNELGSFIPFESAIPSTINRIVALAIMQSPAASQDACEYACSNTPDCFTYVFRASVSSNCVLSRYIPQLNPTRSFTGSAATGPNVPGGYRCAFPSS